MSKTSMHSGRMRGAVVGVLLIGFLAASCGSSSKGPSGASTTAGTGGGTTASTPLVLGPGVTADSIKVGVVAPDFKCFQQFVDQIRTGEKAMWQAYIDA